MHIDSFRLFLIIIICLVIFVLIIIGIVIIIKRFKRRKIKIISRENIINGTTNVGTSIEKTLSPFPLGFNTNNSSNNIQKKTNKKEYLSKEMKINAFCDCFLKPIKYSLVKVYNESCPIDLVPFSPEDEVSVTKCYHGFHFNCIKKFLLENEENKEFKCPICSTIILEINLK